MGTPLQDHLLTIPEVMATLRQGRSTVYRDMQAGRLPSVKIGRRRRVVASDLAAYIRRLRDEAATAS